MFNEYEWHKKYRKENMEMYNDASKKWYEKNKEKAKARRKKYVEENKEKVIAYRKKYRKEHLEELRLKDKTTYQKVRETKLAGDKRYRLKNKDNLEVKRILRVYGVTPEKLEEMRTEANGHCLVCHKKGRLMIDHCHKTNKARGLLCRECNLGLGYMKDNIEILESAIKYLKKTEENCEPI